jgi:hypothetical protein
MAESGRPPVYSEELTTKIRALVLDSVSYKDIQQILEIPTGTWDHWVYTDYEGFRGKLNQWKKERIVKKAEAEIESLIGFEDKRVSLNASTFALETLGKEDYSKRSEITGKDGKDLPIPILNGIQSDNSNKESIEPQEKD